MAGMNSQIHLTIETGELDKLRKEAEDLEISVAELIRRKVASPPIKEEVLELRKLKELLLKKVGDEKNGNRNSKKVWGKKSQAYFEK